MSFFTDISEERRKTVFTAFFGAFCLLAIVIAYFVRFQIPTSAVVPASSIDSYVKNSSWETGFLEAVPYRKGDVLEFAYFAESEFPYSYLFDWSALLSNYELVSLSDASGPISPESLSNSKFRSQSTVILRLRAKGNGNTALEDSVKPKIVEDRQTDIFPEISTGTTSTGTEIPSKESYSLASRSYSSDTNNAVRLVGARPSDVDGVLIGGKTFRGAHHPEGYVFVVERASFSEGEYFVAVLKKDGKLVPLKDSVTFHSDGKTVGVSAITPGSVPSSRDSYVTLQGRGFSKVVSIQLSNSLVIRNASFRLVDDTVAIVRVPAGIPEGTYAMNVMDTGGISSPKNAVLRITK